MKRLLLLLLTFSIAHAGFTQRFPGVVRGTVQDSAVALPNATVSIIKTIDSSLLSFTLTSNSGYFEIKNLDTASYIVSISYQGYQTLQKPFVITHGVTVV
jgi:hypothetical protein